MHSNIESFLQEVEKLVSEYHIESVKRGGDKERRRICLLLKEALLCLTVEDLKCLMFPVCLKTASGAKPLSDIEQVCYLADIFESVLYEKLQEYNLSCLPIDTEDNKKNPSPLKLAIENEYWTREIQRVDLPLVGDVINVLTGNRAGERKGEQGGKGEGDIVMAESHAGGEVVAGFGIEQARFGSFAR